VLLKKVYSTVELGLLAFTPLTSAEIVNYAPSYNTPPNTTLIPASTQTASPEQQIRPLVLPLNVGASPQPTGPSAIVVAQASDASPTVTLSASPTSPALAIGMTVKAANTIYLSPTPTPGTPVIGSEAPGNKGVVIGGPASNSYTWSKVAFDDNLTGWISQSAVAPASPSAPILIFSANLADIAPGASSTLSWSSTNATSSKM
jgi:hypothetical protein